ncbi:hypothetical protein P3T36_006031 [Kitasatospora sp. MAP12-15]|uniref:Imm32 family immunity protein n=1 Tax=unclassified Kitasatospora TaxID=2633591 RepID=UPI002473E4C5|nr:hypothetical protein [Kitasatospora sp. MAP12-44]MDH6109046.1 hypothetical protein [Kitasatospora sp. MAP12-44]
MTAAQGQPPTASHTVTASTDGVSRTYSWEEDARISVRSFGAELVIEANAAGLRTLAGHLLTLAQDGTPDGSHLHLEESNGLEDGSVSLVLERNDE